MPLYRCKNQVMGALVHVTAWERVSLTRRIPCAFLRVAILIFMLAILFNLLGPPTAIFFAARWEARRDPAVKVVPRPLADYSVSNSPGTELSYFGYEFEVPWSGPFKQTVFGKGGIVQLRFESGQYLSFTALTNHAGLLTEIVQDNSMNFQWLQPVFGDLLNRSAYDQYAAMLNTTPQSIRAFGPRADAARGMILLTFKAIATSPQLTTGVFSFELPDKRGFETGDPRKSRRIDLEIFGTGGDDVEIACTTWKDSVRFSQPELNRILTSLHRLPADSSVTSSASIAAPLN
ncbi:MAG: hypothetical protein WBF06_02315 [Candidatus Acidiferrales bacterium]